MNGASMLGEFASIFGRFDTGPVTVEMGADAAPAPAPAALPPVAGTMNVKQALEKMQSTYASLSVLGSGLAQIARASGKPVPCNVLTDYHLAVKDYLRFSQELLDELVSRDYHVEQVVYQGGQPQPDPKDPSKFRTIKFDAPLRPPTFTVSADCTAPRLSGSALGSPFVNLGQVPQAIAASVIIGRLVIVAGIAIGGFVAWKLLEQVRLTIRGPNLAPAERVGAYLECYNRLIASGMPAAGASSQCSGQTEQPGAAAAMGWIILGTIAATAILGYVAWRALSPEQQARRRRIESAKEEVEEAEESAREARRSVRRARRGSGCEEAVADVNGFGDDGGGDFGSTGTNARFSGCICL